MGIKLDEILLRLPDVRKSGNSWRARCPSHGSKSRSLQVSQGNRGVVLHCYFGCSVGDVVGAIGLRVSDLFDGELPSSPFPVQEKRAVTPADVKVAIAAHVHRIVDEESVIAGYEIPVVSRHVNAARAIVARVFGVVLLPVAPLWHEAGLPHDSDPLWVWYCECGVGEIASERMCEAVMPASRADRDEAIRRAAVWIHALAWCDCGSCVQCRARAHAEKLAMVGCGTSECGRVVPAEQTAL